MMRGGVECVNSDDWHGAYESHYDIRMAQRLASIMKLDRRGGYYDQKPVV